LRLDVGVEVLRARLKVPHGMRNWWGAGGARRCVAKAPVYQPKCPSLTFTYKGDRPRNVPSALTSAHLTTL